MICDIIKRLLLLYYNMVSCMAPRPQLRVLSTKVEKEILRFAKL